MDRLLSYAPTVIVGTLLAVAVLLVVVKLVRDRRRGCSGGCGGCPMNGQCHKK